MMDRNSKIYIAGRGMVGGALFRKLESEGFQDIVAPSSERLDLRDQMAVQAFFDREQPDYVFLTAAKVGSVQANLKNPASFLYDNAMIAMNVMHAAANSKVERLMFVASTAIYPQNAQHPITESSLFTGSFNKGNEAYAIAKALGVKYCQYLSMKLPGKFIAVTPSNIYGPNDKYGKRIAHVVPALIARFHEAKKLQRDSVEVWGTGKQVREFLYADDVAEACLLLMEKHLGPGPINIGSGSPVTIKQLAENVAESVGYKGRIVFDDTKPEGASRISVDTSFMDSYGWKPKTSLMDGLRLTYADYLASSPRE